MLVSANGYTQIKVNTMTAEVKRPIIDNKVEHLNIKLYQKNFTIHYPSSSDPSEKVYIYKEETPDYTIIVEGDYTYGFTYEKKIKSFPYNEIKLDAQTGEILSHRILVKDPILPLRIIKIVLPDKTDKNYKKDTTHTFQSKTYTEEE